MITLNALNRDALVHATQQALAAGYTVREGGTEEFFFVYDPAVKFPYTVIIYKEKVTGDYRASCDCAEFYSDLREWELPCSHIAAATRVYKSRFLEKTATTLSHIAPVSLASQLVSLRCKCGRVLDPEETWREGICNDCYEARLESRSVSVRDSLAPRQVVFACPRRAG